MPDPEKLKSKDRAALLSCIKNKNAKWSKKHRGLKPPARVRKNHFQECSRATGVENK